MPVVTTYAESLAESTTIDAANFAQKVAKALTAEAGVGYLGIWSCLIASAGLKTSARLRNQTDATTLGQIDKTFGATSEYVPAFGMFRHVDGGGGDTKTFAIEVAAGVQGVVSKIKEARLTVFPLGDSDAFASSDAETVFNTAGSMSDVVSLTFTPASAGDYLIIATAEVGNTDGGTHEAMVDLYDGSTAFSFARRRFRATTDRVPWAGMVKQTLAASSKTYKIRCGSDFSNAVIRRARLVALRLNPGPGIFADEFADEFD